MAYISACILQINARSGSSLHRAIELSARYPLIAVTRNSWLAQNAPFSVTYRQKYFSYLCIFVCMFCIYTSPGFILGVHLSVSLHIAFICCYIHGEVSQEEFRALQRELQVFRMESAAKPRQWSEGASWVSKSVHAGELSLIVNWLED